MHPALRLTTHRESPMSNALLPSILAAAVLSGLIAGVFFAFSNFVMAALAQRPPAEGMAAMQAINVTVLNGLFLGAFMGTGAIGVLAAVLETRHAGLGSRALLLWAAATLYVAGVIGVTMVANVPMNEHLAKLDAATAAAASDWRDYLQGWTRWNTVRTLAALVASALFALALV